MSTLHQFNWSGVERYQTYLQHVGPEDSLIIYGHFTHLDQSALWKLDETVKEYCYWLTETDPPDKNFNHINYDQWLTLITQHDKTHTWK